jgi:uncharacterized metal-binding protein YceD (DUF177 family)
MSEPLAWSHRVSEIPEGGLHIARAASAAERATLAEALGVVSCEEARAEYVITALGRGRYRMAGKVATHLTQSCVVTLEPLTSQVVEAFDVEFWPADIVPGASHTEEEVLGLPDIEPIEHGVIDAGRVVFETLAAGVDPYPRKEGASFAWPEQAGPSGAGAASPFAKLKALKKKP